ncbi:MAG: UDP-N-acetylmuramoyl-L-alanine--D-glutamate ligase [Planctomycetia bacterium]|jgi:UDP-N-acetylmuramoylalanine--D-glutamate ligase
MIPVVVGPVGILGVGVEGRATIAYLRSIGVRDIVALDRNPVSDLPEDVSTCIGDHYDKNLGRFATLFRSPSIRPDHPTLEDARRMGSRVTSAVSFFLENCPGEVVGITGTLGKGTTASLVAAMSAAAGFDTHLGGNIGRSPLEFLSEVSSESRVVLEISSFQAMDASASPRIGVVLKTTSEHLDWHRNRAEYLNAKAHLFAHQQDDGVVIYNSDIPASRRIAENGASHRRSYGERDITPPGIRIEQDGFKFHDGKSQQVLPIDYNTMRLRGRFNRENVAAALLAALEIGVPTETACRVAVAFEGLPHRLQFIGTSEGICYYNDSYATRPDATIGAVESFRQTPLALILGGSEKYADFSELADVLASHPTLRHISLIGETSDRLKTVLTPHLAATCALAPCDTFEDAVDAARMALRSDEGVVLLSPACASFGMFPNYKVRGEQFIGKVQNIMKT